MKKQGDERLPGCWAASEPGGYPELKPSATRGERLGWLAAMCGRLIKCYEAVNNNAAKAGYRLAVRALERKADDDDQAISDDCYAMLGRMRRLAADVYALACELLGPDGGDFGAAGAIRERAFADVKGAWLTIQHAARVKAALPDAPAGATPPTPQADAPPAPQGFLPIGDLLDFLGITDTKRREAARKTLTRARRDAPMDDRLYKWDSDWGQSGRALYATNRAAELLKKYQS